MSSEYFDYDEDFNEDDNLTKEVNDMIDDEFDIDDESGETSGANKPEQSESIKDNKSYNNYKQNNNYKDKKTNYKDKQEKSDSNWGKSDFFKKEITTDMFKSTRSKCFTVIDNGNITDEALGTIMALVKSLYKKDYKYRSWINSRNRTDTVIRGMDESSGKVEVYRIFKPTDKRPAKDDPVKCTVASDTVLFNTDAYEIANNYDKFFLDKPDIIKAIMAVEVQTLLGAKLDTPVDFVIVYTKSGKTAIDKEFDYKEAKGVTNVLRYCKDAEIPVFNVGSPKFKEDFVRFMSSISSNTEDK